MLALYRTTCHTDHRARPNHELTLIATSKNRDELLTAQNTDVQKWQATELAEHNKAQRLDDLPDLTEWADGEDRFEIEDQELRQFCLGSVDGHTTTLAYHIQEIP